MAPKYRQLHTKIIDSFDFNEMPDDFTRLCWMLLPLISDSAGRGIYNPSWLRSKMFPIRNDVKTEQIQNAFSWFIERGMITIYEVSGRSYFHIPTWLDYQLGTDKEAKSLFPPTQDLLKTYSGVTPDLLLSKSASYSDSDSDSNANADSNATATADSRNAAAANEAAAAVFEIYENNIGMLTSIIAEKIDADIQDYSAAWVIDAITEATRQEKRSLAYAEGILKRWKREGKNSNNKSAGPPKDTMQEAIDAMKKEIANGNIR